MIKKIILIIVLVISGLLLFIYFFNKKEVNSSPVIGNSMATTYQQGDRAVCTNYKNINEINRKDIVIFNHKTKVNNQMQSND